MGNFHSVQFGAPAPAVAEEPTRGTYYGHKPRAFTSKEEMILHTKDVRYAGTGHQQERAFQSYVEECLGLTDNALLGIGTGLEAKMAEPQRRDWQDLGGDLEKDTSTYHSIEESQADMRSPRYKTDPYFREQVARKIDRSTPNTTVVFPKHQSVSVNFLDPGAGEDSEVGFVSGRGETWKAGE